MSPVGPRRGAYKPSAKWGPIVQSPLQKVRAHTRGPKEILGKRRPRLSRTGGLS